MWWLPLVIIPALIGLGAYAGWLIIHVSFGWHTAYRCRGCGHSSQFGYTSLCSSCGGHHGKDVITRRATLIPFVYEDKQ